MPQPRTPAEFVEKWKPVTLPERAASGNISSTYVSCSSNPPQQNTTQTGAEFTFEKGVVPTGGASTSARGDYGYAEVWWRGKFAWEYKRRGKYRDLIEALPQLTQ